MNSEQLIDSNKTLRTSALPNPRPTEDEPGERTLCFVAQSYSVPNRTEIAIGECTINTRNLKIADAFATYRKLSPKSTI